MAERNSIAAATRRMKSGFSMEPKTESRGLHDPRPPLAERSEESRPVPIVQIPVGPTSTRVAVVRRIALCDVLLRIEASRLLEFLRYRDHSRKLILGVLEERLGGAVHLSADLFLVMARNVD